MVYRNKSNTSILLKILSLAVLVSPIGYLLGSRVCLVTNNEKYMPIAVGAGALVNIGLNIWFIYMWGAIGAAIASVISEVVVLVVYLIFSHKFFKFEPDLVNYLKILIAVVLMTGYLLTIHFLVPQPIIKIIAEVVGAIIIYFVTLLIAKEYSVYSMFKKVFKRGK